MRLLTHNTKSWNVLKDYLEEQQQVLTTSLINAKEDSQIHRLQGQLLMVRQLLSLKKREENKTNNG
jgi:hypothetical protein